MGGTRDLVLKVLSAQPSERDVERLVRDLAAQLLPLASRRSFPRIRQEGYRPLDVALLTVAGLLVRDERNRYHVLEKVFAGRGDWLERASPEDFSRFLRAVLARRLQETLFVLAREVWPERAKIRREFLYALKKTPGLVVRKDGGVFTFARSADPAPGGPLPFERVIEASLRGRCRGLRVPDFMARVLSLLGPRDGRRPILLSDMVRAYQEVNSPDLPPLSSGQERDPDGAGPEAEEIQAQIVLWLGAVELQNRKAIRKYVEKGRIPAGDVEAAVGALTAYARDWLEGRPERTLFGLLEERGFSGSAAQYRARHRAAFEYLARKSRALIQERARAWRKSGRPEFAPIHSMRRNYGRRM